MICQVGWILYFRSNHTLKTTYLYWQLVAKRGKALILQWSTTVGILDWELWETGKWNERYVCFMQNLENHCLNGTVPSNAAFLVKYCDTCWVRQWLTAQVKICTFFSPPTPCFLVGRDDWGDFSSEYKYLKGRCWEGKQILSSGAQCRTRGNSQKVKHRKFCLNMKKIFFALMVMEQ